MMIHTPQYHTSSLIYLAGDHHAVHSSRMPLVGKQGVPAAGVPYLHSIVSTPRGEALAIGRPIHTPYSAGMPFIGEQEVSVVGVPDAHSLVIAGRGEMLAIGGPGHILHSGHMPSIRKRHVPAPALPHQPR